MLPHPTLLSISGKRSVHQGLQDESKNINLKIENLKQRLQQNICQSLKISRETNFKNNFCDHKTDSL